MGNSPSCLDEPLKPHYSYGPPPWYSRFGFAKRNYDGRPDWWTECGMSDEFIRNNKWRGYGSRFLEEENAYFDPKVEDGTSVSGPFGLDTRYHPDLTKKADQVGNFYEFSNKVMKESAQYKQIAEKYDISKEHPGIDVNPVLDGVYHHKASQLGKYGFYPNSWHHFGPRFWDKPINEGCFEKGLCALKYTALVVFPITIVHLKAHPPAETHAGMLKIWGWKAPIQRYFSLLPIPAACSFSYAVSLCTSANLRKKDDLYNYCISSGVFGATLAAINSVPIGIGASVVSLLFGTVFHYARLDPSGLQGRLHHQMTSGTHTGPLAWKHLLQGDAKLPARNF